MDLRNLWMAPPNLGGVELAFVYAFGCLTQNAVKCFDFKRFPSCCKNQNI